EAVRTGAAPAVRGAEQAHGGLHHLLQLALGLGLGAIDQAVHVAGEVGRTVQQHAVVARQVRQQGGQGGAGGGVGLAAQAGGRSRLRRNGRLGGGPGQRHGRSDLERGRSQRLGFDRSRGREQRCARQGQAQQEQAGRPAGAGGGGGG